MPGLAGLSVLLAMIFILVSYYGSSLLQDWVPPEQEVGSLDSKIAVFRGFWKMPATPKIDLAKDLETAKDRFLKQDAGQPVGIDDTWYDDVSLGMFLPEMQGVTGVQMLVHDLSTVGFLNRTDPLVMDSPMQMKPKVSEMTELQIREEKEREILRAEIKAISAKFKIELRIPETILSEELRRVEEIYLAITQGKVEYSYLHYEIPVGREQALEFVSQYEQRKAGTQLMMKIPAVIEVFGNRFDLGICTLTFPDARLEPTLEQIKQLQEAEKIHIRISPLKPPGKILADYEKFASGTGTKQS